jgi:hypothetical protein
MSKSTRFRPCVGRLGVGHLCLAIVLLAGAVATVVAPDSGSAAATDQTLTVHIYQCSQYVNNGAPDLKTSATEINGGTATIEGVTSAQANPVSSSVGNGSYTVEATAPAGYYFTDCPGESVTPTLSNEDQAASGSVSVSSSALSAAFYVVAFQTATCAATNGGVTCTLPTTLGLPYYPLNSLVSEANQVSSSVSLSTPIVITAYGGNGGNGYNADPGVPSGGNGGAGGEAQSTLTSIANYESTYKSAALFYYLGYQGIGNGNYGDKVGGIGGSSTIVSPDNFATGSTSPCISGYNSCTSSTIVLLVAGGGGGGGEGGDSNTGANAGAGGTAVSTPSGNANSNGANGSSAGGDGGHGGYGAGQNPSTTGAGGAGGKGGDGADNHSGGTGSNGIGGVGGSMHKSSGPSKSLPWANAGYLTLVGSNGSGGEGEWRGTGVADGGSGSGGGGFGGGGAGGSGGVTDAGGGAGGGGSFALQAALTPQTFTTPSHTSGNGQVYITFVLS